LYSSRHTAYEEKKKAPTKTSSHTDLGKEKSREVTSINKPDNVAPKIAS
jgi:hypothetical protein